MKRHLFYTFLWIFAATCVVTLLGVMGVLHISDGYLNALFTAFIIELGGAVIAIFKGAKFFIEEGKPAKEVVSQLQETHRNEIAEMKEDQAQREAQTQSTNQRLGSENATLIKKNMAFVEENLKLIEENLKLKQTLSLLQIERVFHHKTGIVFKRSRETGNQWRAFCPICGKPMTDVDLGYENARACCVAPSPPCGRCFPLPSGRNLEDLASHIPITD